ncbi:MAG TPA: hypothetical protein VFJ52_09065, partial [Terriglobia bacterium]|nr:hypothetical protein [Terriglobia bacterium]
YRLAHTFKGFAAIKLAAFLKFWSFFLGAVFTFPLLLAWVTLPYGFSFRQVSSRTRFLLTVCGITIAGEALPIWYNPHYSAPIACAILAFVLIALRRLRAWQWRGKSAGKFIARAVPSICVLLLALRVVAGPLHVPLPPKWPTVGLPEWCSPEPMNWRRAEVLRKLRQMPGRQLVIVHYGPQHDPYFEWVYNRAELNSAKVIWARDMGPEKNKELIDYFKDRHVWLVYADDNPPRLEPYSESRAASGASRSTAR